MSDAASSTSEEQFAALVTLVGKSGLELESVIHGTSMGRAIPNGSRIRITTGRDGAYNPGQIVACVQGADIFAHRVVYRGRTPRTRDYLITQGDGCLFCDKPMHISEVLGIVREVSHDNEWCTPTTSADRTTTERQVARASLCLVSGCLRVHPRLACGMAAWLLWLDRLLACVRATS